jgi:hypothetical protein
MSNENQTIAELKLDQANLFREESYTDLRVGSIQRLIPVKTDGTVDEARASMFVGEAQLMSPAGPVPLRAEIPAANLQEAIERFPDAMQRAVERLMAEIKEMQRQQSSRLVIPGAGGGLPPDLGRLKLK